MSRVSTSPTARASPSIRRRGTSASATVVLPRSEDRPEDRDRRRRHRRLRCRRRAGRCDADTDAVARASGAPRAMASTRGTPSARTFPAGKWTRHDRPPIRCRSTSHSPTAAISSSRRGQPRRRRPLRGDPHVVLRRSATATRRGQRFDHNRIDLVPERKTYKPGDTARIMIQSPWEQATALVTTEREGHPHPSSVRADLDAAVDLDSDRRGRHPERLRVGAAGQGPNERAAATAASHRGGAQRRTKTPAIQESRHSASAMSS